MSEVVLRKFVLGPIEDNNYLLIDSDTKEAILIDCTQESKAIDDAINEFDAKLKYILLTHGHFDHVLGVNDFKLRYPDCKVLIHADEKDLMANIKSFARNFMLGEFEVQKVDEYINDGDIFKFGENEIKVIHTPGHTKGGVCYLIGDKIFTGDTLFYESVGRTDLPGGDFQELKSNIESKLFTLNEEIKVYPGHGWESTIGHEKNNNKFL